MAIYHVPRENGDFGNGHPLVEHAWLDSVRATVVAPPFEQPACMSTNRDQVTEVSGSCVVNLTVVDFRLLEIPQVQSSLAERRQTPQRI